MEFVFNCPATGKIFETAAFRMVDNRRLDARVAIEEPCPHCGRHHTYRADEMICPFEAVAVREG